MKIETKQSLRNQGFSGDILISNKPRIIRVDQLLVSKGHDAYSSHSSLGSQNILYCHGYDNGFSWVTANGFKINDIVQEAKRQGITIDALFVCNPGGYTLDENVTYISKGKASGTVNLDDSLIARLRAGDQEERLLQKINESEIIFL